MIGEALWRNDEAFSSERKILYIASISIILSLNSVLPLPVIRSIVSGVNQSHPVSTPIQLAATLRALRKSRGLTQEAVGRLLGVSQKRIAWIESVPGRTSFDQLSRLVAALGGRMVIEVPPEEVDRSPGKRARKPAVKW